MANTLSVPPVLSTPDVHILNDTSVSGVLRRTQRLSDEQLETRYEIARTIREIKQHKWGRVALQFPDDMLPDSARVFQSLARGLNVDGSKGKLNAPFSGQDQMRPDANEEQLNSLSLESGPVQVKLTILGDTSYGSCCVDEIAAEHVDADAVVHYGRACLSPTSRLPVIHIFTTRELDIDKVTDAFITAFPNREAQVIVTADVPYAAHVETACLKLKALGYNNMYPAQIVHNPSSPIPNRTIPQSVLEEPLSLREWHLFHISEPPTSLLLTLASRIASIRVYSTSGEEITAGSTTLEASTSIILRRRYALITSLSTVPIWGILINTLSVKNYMYMVDHVKSIISNAGKKSYLFVVGKINPAKLANFSEISGWIVIGCWESSLIDNKDFYKPIITPFELDLALSPDNSRVWTGEWRSDFEGVMEAVERRQKSDNDKSTAGGHSENAGNAEEGNFDSEEESEPPEFDLRTGRYVSRTRPMRTNRQQDISRVTNGPPSATALAKRASGDIVSVNGIASPAAEFLAQRRTWKGLGSDFQVRYEEDEEGCLIEEGRTGVASGYTVGESGKA